MERKWLTSGRWVSKCCFLGLCGWAFSCSATGIKGIAGSHRAALPGVDYLLPRGLGKEVAGILAHGRQARAAALSENKGTTTVAAGINAFLSPAIPPGTGVASDGSLGNGRVSYGAGKYTIPASVGTQVGGNLFESFSQFNLLEGEVADFLGPSNVADIIARITGGISSIDGAIESGIQGANVFLINPAGFIFGPGASLKVSGAFTVSTADYLKLADGGKFNTILGGDDILTAASVSTFGFTGAGPASVSFTGSQLSVPVGAGLNVIAGNIALAGARLSAPSGGLTVFSAASAGEVPFSLTAPGAGYAAATFSALGRVSLVGLSFISINGAGGGSLMIRAGMISVDDSAIVSENSGSIAGGDIAIEAGSLDMESGGAIFTNAGSSGNGGNVAIEAGSLDLDSGAEIATDTVASGKGGTVVIEAGALDIDSGAEIAVTTFSSGNGGNVTVDAGSLNIDGSATPALLTGIFAVSDDGATGNAGDLDITVNRALGIEGGGEIGANIYGFGNDGNLTIHAGSLSMVGSATSDFLTGIFARSEAGATGNAGDLNITVAGALDMEDGDIGAGTFSSGEGGNLKIQAGSLNLDGSAIGADSNPGATGNAGDLNISVTGALDIEDGGSIAADTDSSGKGGTVVIQAGSLDLESGAAIAATTFSSGNGGNVTVDAGSLNIDGSATPTLLTGIFAGSEDSATGNAGDLDITVTRVLGVEGGGQIAADTSTSGLGGNVVIQAGSVEIRSGGQIAAAAFSSGDGGNVTVDAGSLNIDASATPALATGIFAASNTGATGNAGDIHITVAGALDILNGGEIHADTFSPGKGGNVIIQAGSLNINGSATPSSVTGIGAQSAEGATGNAGDLTVNVAGAITISGEGVISATTSSSGNGGNLTVRAGSLEIAGVNGDYPSAIEDGSEQGDPGDSGGNGGSLRVVVRGSLTLEGDADIDTDTSTSGKAGDLTVDAASILIDGESFDSNAASISAAAKQGATGAGGNISINAGNLVIQAGGNIDTDTNDDQNAGDLTVNAGSLSIIGDLYGTYISSDTGSGGRAGDVTVSAESILIDGQDYFFGAYISADALPGATGAGGEVTINAGNLIIQAGGSIDTDTYDNKNAGNLTVNAGSLSILGNPNDATEITSDTYSGGSAGDVTVSADTILIDGAADQVFTGIAAESDSGATGKGGNVTIDAGTLSIAGSGQISAGTYSPGNGGDVAVSAQDINISGFFDNFPSGIFASSVLATTNAGAAGGVSIQCGNLTLEDGGEIAADATASSAGDVVIDVRQNVIMENQAGISTSAGVSGGNINIQAGGLLYLLDSSLFATAGSDRSANGAATNPTAGKGGNITIDSEFIVLNDSLISANAAAGQGGNILLETTYYLSSGSALTATGATSGTVTITSPELDLSGALVGLPASLVGYETQLQETCAMALNGDFSSFLAVGEGDIEAAPDEALGATGDGGAGPRERAVDRKPAHRSGLLRRDRGNTESRFLY